MTAADVQLVVGILSMAGVVAVAVYNGWVNSRRSREERTSPAYSDLVAQVTQAAADAKDDRDRLDQLEKDRTELREKVDVMASELREEREERAKTVEAYARFTDQIGLYLLGQAAQPIIPEQVSGMIDRDIWDQIPQDERRFRFRREQEGNQ